ncbi:MAG TPA: substrate-binding domain-containing protein, partial [Polyangiaceae bacterium]|nr:substrate-binding domain-containing protein [Polyangiaceae bacterium]
LVFLECSNEIAGFQIGQFLITRGHRRVCFVHYHRDTPWAKGRFEGLARAFRLAGMPDGVRQSRLFDVDAPSADRTEAAENEWLDGLLATGATAWVTGDDSLATRFILPLLERHGLVPGSDISLMGFNDQADAFFERLTSYNFNSDGLASAMLFYAQFPGRRRRPRRKGHDPVKLTGYIVDRGSVAMIVRN